MGEAYLVFTVAEAQIAAAVFERMFPADEHDPGAKEIGVLKYVDQALGGVA